MTKKSYNRTNILITYREFQAQRGSSSHQRWASTSLLSQVRFLTVQTNVVSQPSEAGTDDLPVYFICFRECLETGVIVSILLAFIKQTLGPDKDPRTYKKLVRQVSRHFLYHENI